MEGYSKSSHAIYRCEYHFVWVPKYRYHILIKEVKPRLKELLVELCEWLDLLIIEGAICFMSTCMSQSRRSIPRRM